MGKSAPTVKKRYKHSKETRDPKSAREFLFCREWLTHNDHIQAARAANYSEPLRDGLRLKKKFLPYLSAQKKLVEKEVAREIVYDQKDLLNEMAGIAFANPLDYVVVTRDDKTGKKIYSQKPIDELDRRQASAISDVEFKDGQVTYHIPNPSEKYRYLFSLSKNLGLFNDKLIMEFRHSHLHKSLDFKDASNEELMQLENLLVSMLGDPAKEILGLPNYAESEV